MAIVLLGFAVRLHNLAGDSLWFDEMLSINVARRGLDGALSVRGHPPLYYLLVYGVMQLGEESEFLLRLPSAVAGILAIPLMIVLGRLVARQSVGQWSAVLLALSPFHLRYSQEVRHYAWLMAFSLASYLFLYMALTKDQRRWWGFFALATLLNLYTHYGSLVVLATQGALIVLWNLWKLLRGQRIQLLQPGTAALVVILLYLPWLRKLLAALAWNLGESSGRGGVSVSMWRWIQRAYVAFGSTSSESWSLVVILLCLIGLLTLVYRQKWSVLVFVITWLVGPFLLITLFSVEREALPKYIIYVLPPYLLMGGVGIHYVVHQTTRYVGESRIAPAIPLGIACVLLLGSFPHLSHEYDRIERDWKGVAQRLGEVADEDDIVFSMSLDMTNGFNPGPLTIPYYVDQYPQQLRYLHSFHLSQQKLRSLIDVHSDIWAVILDHIPPIAFDGTVARLDRMFQGSLYLVHVRSAGRSSFDNLLAFNEQMFPMALAPSPRCLLKQDQARLLTTVHDYEGAESLFAQAADQCAGRELLEPIDHQLEGEIYHGLLDQYVASRKTAQARDIAGKLLELDAKDVAALDTITYVNLLRAFEREEASVDDGAAAEPVQVREFTMPQNGDWGEVIFAHAPASVSYEVQLPAEPTALSFRVALAPETWNWGGDGVTFVISAETEQMEVVELFRQHVSNSVDDNDWHVGLVPLDEHAGQEITITLKTEPGPAGDTSGDWAGWETPRIVYHDLGG